MRGEERRGKKRERQELPEAFSRMATIPTPSISEPLGRVLRSACSQVRSTPRGSE